MSPETHVSFWAFRKRLMFRFALALIGFGFLFKYLNVLVAFLVTGENTHVDEVAGMKLLKLMPGLDPRTALEIGAGASFAALIAMAGVFLVNKIPVHGTRYLSERPKLLQRELQTYALLLFMTVVGGAATGQNGLFIALINFVPLLVFTLLNPGWGSHRVRGRFALGFGLALAAFVFAGSKTIIFFLVFSMTLTQLYRGTPIVKVTIPLLFFLIIYPYLNVFRGSVSEASVNGAAALTLIEMENEFSDKGLFGLIQSGYGAILNRIVGLDGLFIAHSLRGVPLASSADLSFELLGYTGVGISLGLLGQFDLYYQDLWTAALVYPLAVILIWRMAVVLDAWFARLGFLSAGLLVYLKAGMIIMGGLRLADIKITGFTFGVILLVALVLHQMKRAHSGRTLGQRALPEATAIQAEGKSQ